LAWLARKYKAKHLHAICLTLAGIGLYILPYIKDPAFVFIPMIGMGLSWASMMGNPYIILAGSIPPKRTGVYMGIFNMFIVIPMLLQNVTMPLYYKSWLGNNLINAMKLAGVMLVLGAICTLFIRSNPSSKEVKKIFFQQIEKQLSKYGFVEYVF
jgi:maltose/moltooligosaccharide transporter